MNGCVATCFGLSVFSMVVLTIWGFMLLHHSPTFEIPDRLKTSSGWACLLSAVLYAIVALLCGLNLALSRKRCPEESIFARARRLRVRSNSPNSGALLQPLLEEHRRLTEGREF